MTQYFHPEDFRINDLVTELSDRGHEVHVLTGHPNYPSGSFAAGYGGIRPRRERFGDVNVVRVPMAARGNGSGAKLLMNYLTFAASACMLGPFLMRGRYDAVFTFQVSPLTVAAPALLLSRTKRAPAVMWVQDLWPETLLAMGVLRGKLMKKAASSASSLLHRGMRRLLVQSPVYQGALEKQGVVPERIDYVPNWAESLYAPVVVPPSAVEREAFGPGFNVVFAGNIGDAQGVDTLVGAMRRLADIDDLNWIVLGDGRRSAWLAEKVAEAGLQDRVHLLGRKPVESMPRWFALADLLIATLRPDPVFQSTIPSKLQTYLACGRPVVAGMDGEGARVVREAGAGATSPAGDDEALAAAVRWVYAATPDERQAMGENARRYYLAHFSRDDVIDDVERILIEESDAQRMRRQR